MSAVACLTHNVLNCGVCQPAEFVPRSPEPTPSVAALAALLEEVSHWVSEERGGDWDSQEVAERLLPRLGDAPPEPAEYESAVSVEFPSGNWAGILDADLASVLVPLWNAQADENQILRAEPMKRQGLGPNQEERKPRIGVASRARAPGGPEHE